MKRQELRELESYDASRFQWNRLRICFEIFRKPSNLPLDYTIIQPFAIEQVPYSGCLTSLLRHPSRLLLLRLLHHRHSPREAASHPTAYTYQPKKRRRIQQAKDSPSSLGCSDPQQKQFDGIQAPLCRRCGLLHHTSLGRPSASTSSYRSPKHQREASRSSKRNADQAELISALEVEIAQLERRSELERSLRSNKLAVFHWLCSSNSRPVFTLLLASNTLRKQPCSNRHSLRWTPS
jgi:hypothetical protein